MLSLLRSLDANATAAQNDLVRQQNGKGQRLGYRPSSRTSTASKKSNSSSRGVDVAFRRVKVEDDDDVIDLTEKPERKLLYSGHLGKESPLLRIPSEESIATELSLMSFSTANSKMGRKKKIRRRGKRKEDPPKKEMKWVELAKKTRMKGLLDRMIQKDKAEFSNYIHQDQEIPDMMEEDERHLLHLVRRTRGLKGNVKSGSTSNISNIHDIPKRIQTALSRNGGNMSGKRKTERSVSINPQLEGFLASPRASPHLRPTSVNTTHQLGTQSKSKRPLSRTRMTFNLPDYDRPLTEKVKYRIRETVRALERVTGTGDPPTVCRGYFDRDEAFPYIENDFTQVPRIPQNVRIAPQLSKVIKADIKHRMGRPRYHEVRKADLAAFDKAKDRGIRSNRNLMIFDWLNSINEDYYDHEASVERIAPVNSKEDLQYDPPDIKEEVPLGEKYRFIRELEKHIDLPLLDNLDYDDGNSEDSEKIDINMIAHPH
ncbi:unnamed protein product [Owenia fusiformis]|uniref:Uncharacterized protein n=1 Tax=Owenia fusiformis TaxID=6347 RepID=A0A8S4NNT5_OWEFU|nr:unnamed protein product [Owenia fusiformis]